MTCIWFYREYFFVSVQASIIQTKRVAFKGGLPVIHILLEVGAVSDYSGDDWQDMLG